MSKEIRFPCVKCGHCASQHRFDHKKIEVCECSEPACSCDKYKACNK